MKSLIRKDLLSQESRSKLALARKKAQPYEHLHVDDMFQEKLVRNAQNEAKYNLTAEFKESDLFKVYQTIDLGNLQASDKRTKKELKNLFTLKEYLYSPEFRQFVCDITGVSELTDRVDCSMNIYTNGCHLLCHDDVIGTRRVSYIIYLTDPDEEWLPEEGGALELFPLDPASIDGDSYRGDSNHKEQSGSKANGSRTKKVKADSSSSSSAETSGITREKGNSFGPQGVPLPYPTTALLPKFNSMAIFAVQPGRSYHAVQEVYSDNPRLSISGWFHGATPPDGSDLASLKQIMTRGDASDPFLPLRSLPLPAAPNSTSPPPPLSKSTKTTQKVTKSMKIQSVSSTLLPTLDTSEMQFLRQYVNPTYLTAKTVDEINQTFCDQSSIQLKDFLLPDIAAVLEAEIARMDQSDQLGDGACPRGYTVGADNDWRLIGPPHKRRYLQYQASSPEPVSTILLKDALQSHTKSSKSTASSVIKRDVGSILTLVHSQLFQSTVFAKYLHLLTSLKPTTYRGEVRRFRPGLDYTVAHYGGMTVEPRLDATLCFVALQSASHSDDTKEVVDEENDDADDDEDDDEDYDNVWASGDVGGFECYIEADADAETAEAAEVFRSASDGYGGKRGVATGPDSTTSDPKRRKVSDKNSVAKKGNNPVEKVIDVNEDDDDEEAEGEDSTSLLSISPGFNVLNLVLRDDKVMRFVKYLSARAPSSRWDVAVEYTFDQDDDEDEDEE